MSTRLQFQERNFMMNSLRMTSLRSLSVTSMGISRNQQSFMRSFSSETFQRKGKTVLEHLDGSETSSPSKQEKFSRRANILRKTLRSPAKKVLDSTSEGISEATSQDLTDFMNEYLEKNKVFKSKGEPWAIKTSDYLEITECDLNQDYSHCHAQWSCPAFDHLLKQLLKVDKSQSCAESMSQVSFQERYNMAKKVEKKMNLILERLEGKFRSHIIREVNLRRVPRIFFVADKRTTLMLEQLKRAAAA